MKQTRTKLLLTVLSFCMLCGTAVSANETKPEPTEIKTEQRTAGEQVSIRGDPKKSTRAAQPRYNFDSNYYTTYDFQNREIWTDGWVQNRSTATESLKFFFSPAYGNRTPIQWLPAYTLGPGKSTSMYKSASIKGIVGSYTDAPGGYFWNHRLEKNQDRHYVNLTLDTDWHEFGLGLTFGADGHNPNSSHMAMGWATIYDPIVKYEVWTDGNSANVYDKDKLREAWSIEGYKWENIWEPVSTKDAYIHLNGLSLTGEKIARVFRIPAQKQYTVSYNGNTGTTTARATTTWAYKNTTVSNDIPVKTGYTFVNWNTNPNGTGTAYARGGSVGARSSNLVLYAQYKPNKYTLTFDKNNPRDALVGASDVVLSTGSMTSYYDSPWGTLATASKPGYLFEGWYLKPDGGEQLFANTIVRGDLTVYAHWKPITYLLRFHPNQENGDGTVTGTMPALTLTYDRVRNLPKSVYQKETQIPSEDAGGDTCTLASVFLGWSLQPETLQPAWADEAKVLNLTQKDGTIFDLYAIWDDAPSFIITAYPDRYFTVEEAQTGVITERELLETVIVSDRETNPLPKKDKADVTNTGSDVGVTVVGYDEEEFTGLDDDAEILIRYKVKDAVGNETYLNINVHVTRNGKIPEQELTYFRSISSDYHEKAPHEGGLAEDSYWRKDAAGYGELLQGALGSSPTLHYDLTLRKRQLRQIRDHVGTNGFGNVNANGLETVWSILGEE